MRQLTKDQQNLVAQYIDGFKKYLTSKDAEQWRIDTVNKRRLFQETLSREKIDNLSEKDFGRVVKSLWASDVWTNKQWIVDKIVDENGLLNLRRELKKLLFGENPIEVRFDRFRKKVKYMGVSYISEILFTMFPDSYCLLNKRTIDFLSFIGIAAPGVVRGKEYVESLNALKLVRNELAKHGFKNPNFWDVDLFVWYIASKVLPRAGKIRREPEIQGKAEVGEEINVISDHTEVMGILLELGRLSGFETYVSVTDRQKKYKEKKLGELATLSEIPEELKGIKDIERVDVIWFNKYSPPSYFFEVEVKGTMREALHRLYQARYLNARFFVVSPKENRQKFERWLRTAPFKNVKRMYNFKTFGELIALYNSTVKYHRLKTNFGIS